MVMDRTDHPAIGEHQLKIAPKQMCQQPLDHRSERGGFLQRERKRRTIMATLDRSRFNSDAS